MSEDAVSEMVDDDLIEEARNGSQPAMLELYTRHGLEIAKLSPGAICP